MVEVVAYRDEWPHRFEELRSAYATALSASGARFRIEHVGSTSVPGLAAKPVIDVDVVVPEGDVPIATGALVAIGFAAQGDLGVDGRFAFETPERFAPSNTYVVVEGSLAVRNHLAVRDTLRASTELRDAYAAVKRSAASRATGIDEYLAMKGDVLERILQHAGLSDAERAAIAAANSRIAERGARG